MSITGTLALAIHDEVDRRMRGLARRLYPYGAERSVLRGPAAGMRFIVEPGMASAYAVGTSAAAPRFFSSRVRRGMTVFDVGANRGQMALLFARLVGASGRVVALEPAPEPFQSLKRNTALNRLEHLHVLEAAASDHESAATFTYSDERPTQGKLADVETTYRNPGARSFPVRTLRLDTLLGTEPPPDVVKIDAEGAGARVLRGAARILDEYGPNVYLELHGPEEQAGVRDELLSRGYMAQTLDGRSVADPVAVWHSPLWCVKRR